MNNKKYSIGFLIAGLAAILLISGAYQISYYTAVEHAKEEKVLPEAKEPENIDSVAAEGEATEDYSYYLLEENGYVVVYLSDKKTIYEYTSIDVEELPVLLQNEVKNGKYIKDIEELYGFLENYSS